MMRGVLVLLCVLVLTGCGDPDGARDGDADGPEGSWVLVEGVPLVDGYPVTLRIEGEQVSGTAACNTYSGTASISADAFTVGDVARTEMGCPEPGVHESEAAYSEALALVESWSRTGDELVLTGGDDIRLRFTAEQPG